MLYMYTKFIAIYRRSRSSYSLIAQSRREALITEASNIANAAGAQWYHDF